MPNTRIEVDTTVIDRILRNAGANAEAGVRKIAFSLEGKTKRQIRAVRAIDTGALINSVYTRTYRGAAQDGTNTSEGQVQARVRSLNRSAELEQLPVPRGPHEAFVGPSVKYALHVHYGTTRRSGRPFLRNAVDEIGRELQDAFRDVATDGQR